MEACPRLPAFNFDLKLAVESTNLCEKIPNYITTNYQDNGGNFSNECEQINRLRQNAINCSIDENSLQYLKRYFAQLQLLRNRFPMLHDGECAVRYTWEDAYQKEENTYDDIRFEETCILYNIGSLYSRLGGNELRKTHESMKNACTFFRYSAGCYEKLRDQYTPYSLDLTPELLTCQIDTLLGQAHEAVLEKSLLDRRPASVNAHLAMQISEYFQKALTTLLKSGMSSIVSRRFREWRVALTYKSTYYLSLAYYFCGLIAEDSKKRGEAVCYYENALERLKDGWKNAEKISSDRTAIYKDAHTFTNDILTFKHKTIKRDNDNVYFEKVPNLSNLPTIQGVIVAKPQAFEYHDPNVSGDDIFQKLIPMDTHLAASEYSEEKAKLLRDIGELIENKNRELETFLTCLQLNRIPFNNNYLQLPREFIDCCATLASRTNMSQDLKSIMQVLNQHHENTFEQLTQFEQLLESKCESLKLTKDYQDIQRNTKSNRELLLQANESNKELNQHLSTMIEHFQILQLPIEQIEKHLPIISELEDETNKPKLARLALLNEKIQTMKKQREVLFGDFRKKIQDDDITKLVLMQRQENHKSLFSEQLKKHDELVNLIKQNCLAQEHILQALTEANADIAEIRTKISTAYDNRQNTIEELMNSCQSFDDSIAKANEGIEFYKKQAEKIILSNERLTKLQLTEDKKPIVDRSIAKPDFDVATPRDRPRLIDYLPIMKPDTWASNKSDNNLCQSPQSVPTNNNPHQFYQPTILPEQTSPYRSIPPPSLSSSYSYEQNLVRQTPPSAQPQMIYQSMAQSFYPPNPSVYSYQTVSNSNRPIAQSTLPPMPAKFDPYRPQPVGAYDIPKMAQPTLANPQDVYRPGGLLGMNSIGTPPTMNFYNYEPNPYGQYIPSSTNSASVNSSFANLSINSMLNQ